MRKLILCGAAAIVALALSAKDKPVRPSVRGMGRLRLVVTDAQSSRDFYCGILALGPGANRCPKGQPLCYSIQQDQQIERQQAETAKDQNLLLEVGFETGDAAQLRSYLQSKGAEPRELTKSPEGNQSFAVLDPEGHRIVFIQYPFSDNSITVVNQVSTHMIHAGFVVHDRAAEDRFYKDILGFHVYWHGGMTGGEDNWVDMQVPDGTDWIEHMLGVSPNASHKTLAVMNHIPLGVPDIHAAEQQLLKNGWDPTKHPKTRPHTNSP